MQQEELMKWHSSDRVNFNEILIKLEGKGNLVWVSEEFELFRIELSKNGLKWSEIQGKQ